MDRDELLHRVKSALTDAFGERLRNCFISLGWRVSSPATPLGRLSQEEACKGLVLRYASSDA